MPGISYQRLADNQGESRQDQGVQGPHLFEHGSTVNLANATTVGGYHSKQVSCLDNAP